MPSPPSQDREKRHRDNGGKRRSDAGHGPRPHSQAFSFLPGPRHRGDDRPVRDVRQRIGNAAQKIRHRDIHLFTAGGQSLRHREHRVHNERVQNGARQDPRLVPAPGASCLCHHDAHDGIVKGIKDPGRHEQRSHKRGADAQNGVVIIQRVRRDQAVGDILSQTAQRVRRFHFCRYFQILKRLLSLPLL